MLAKIEGQYRERLKTDPVPEELADLHTIVR